MGLSHDKARKLRGLMESTLKTPNDWDARLCDPDNYVFKTYPRNPEDHHGVICHYVAECTVRGYEYWTLPHKITYADLEMFGCRDVEDRKQMIRMFTMEALAAKSEQLMNSKHLASQVKIMEAAALATLDRGDFKTD